MRKNNLKKIVSAGLAFSLAASLLLGCSGGQKISIEPMEAEESNAISFDFIGGKDVMPIGAFYGPHVSGYSIDGQNGANLMEEKYFEAMADAGINLMLQSQADYTTSPALMKISLDLCEKYGIGVCVNDAEVRTMGEDGSDIDMVKLTDRVSKYITHPACVGFYLQDEPWTTSFEPVASQPERSAYVREKLAKKLHTDLGIFTYANLLSSGLREDSFPIYEDYVREMVDLWDLPYILYDRYPFDAPQEGHINRYFYDLAVVRKVANENNIPYWVFIQAGGQWNDAMEYFDSAPYYPHEGQFDWNMNTSLAFGVKGFAYFLYTQPYYFAYAKSQPLDSERNGMIGIMGNKNRWFYYSQDITKHIAEIDEVLMNSTHKGVIASGETVIKDMEMTKDYDVLFEGTAWRELKSVTGDAIVGCFNYQGKTALYVVNYDMEYAQKINLEFQDSYNVTVIQGAETKDVKGDGMTLDLLAGDGALLVFE